MLLPNIYIYSELLFCDLLVPNRCHFLLVQVRLKKYLEMRGADAGPLTMLCALPAFWVDDLFVLFIKILPSQNGSIAHNYMK